MYFIVLDEKLSNYDFDYQLGLNIDTKYFDDCPNRGIYFYESKNVPLWLNYGSNLAFISIPEDAEVVHFNDKSKTSKVVIEKIINVKDWEMWENEEFCLKAVKLYTKSLKFVKNQTDDIVLAAIKKNPNSLELVKNQNETICLQAVKRDGKALQYVKDQTDEICLEALKNEGNALEDVRNQTDVLCLQAIKQNGNSFEFIKNKRNFIDFIAFRNLSLKI